MHKRKEFLIGTTIGVCIVLVASLLAAIAPRSQTAYAQDPVPSASISLGEDTLPQGSSTYLVVTLSNMPKKSGDETKVAALTYKFELQRNDDGSWVDANDCGPSGFGDVHHLGDKTYSTRLTVQHFGYFKGAFPIGSDCPTGSYRVQFTVKLLDATSDLASDTKTLTVVDGPSITIELPSGPYYRGASFDATIKFHALIQGEDYSYKAMVMNDNPNYAENCEGAGLGKNEKFSLSSVDENPEVRAGTVASTCPTENYALRVRLYNSDNREKASKTAEFVIVTNPDAKPSVKVSMSKTSPVAPGTEFDITFSFYDLKDGTAIEYREVLTNTVTNLAEGQTVCGGGLVGWGQDVGATVFRNPIVNRVTISSDCPVGSYKLGSVIEDSSGGEIISGSADFTIGYPNLTPTAPNVSNYTAKQNSYFNQELPEGSGGDGTLRYAAAPLPTGLSFDDQSRTIAGTPTVYGPFTVTYTVTDADGDPDSAQFTITVNQDLSPSAPAVLNYTGKVGIQFVEQLPQGSGGDGTLSYGATGLPAGLTFIASSRTITGTPTSAGPATVKYTVTDQDSDSAYVDFSITIAADLEPTLGPISGFTAKEGSHFSEVLPAANGGDTPLRYTATGLPDGLSFDDGTRTVSGTPTKVESPTVTYTPRTVRPLRFQSSLT